MHVLPRLRRGRPWRPLSQLRRRIGAPADPAARPIAASPRRDAADTEAGRMHLDMSLRASRRGLVPPFIAMDVLRAANEREAGGADVIHLEVGQPGRPATEPVLAAARAAVPPGPIRYADALGMAP